MAHIQVPLPPRLPAGWRRPSRWALRTAPVVLKPRYVAATAVVTYGGYDLLVIGVPSASTTAWSRLAMDIVG